jgi:Fe(II)/alpha-ketoglutarate-dependent arginine beta-hydroxylase
MQKIMMSEAEIASIRSLLTDLASHYHSVEDPEFLRNAAVYAHELPWRLRSHLNDFRLLEPSSALCILSGYPIDDERIGNTPCHWKNRPAPSPALAEEMLLVLFGCLLGDVIGWSTQQDGRIVHELCPIRGHEGEQLGTGSEQLLWWHTEDAFHPYRGDYLGMLCLRNLDRVATTFANLEQLDLTGEQAKLLFEPHFTIRPDESHLVKNKLQERQLDPLLAESYQRIERMNSRPEKIALLHGDPRSPYIRIDPYFMDPLADPAAQSALDHLVQAIEGKLVDVVLEPGDFCFIDNFKAVHGRKPFKARYDGRDRWMKRINVARDLRRSRTARSTSESRIIC